MTKAPLDNDPIQLKLSTDGFQLLAEAELPVAPRGVVVMANGSHPELRDMFVEVAKGLRRAGFATVIVDLMTEVEVRLIEQGQALRASLPFLRRRLSRVLDQIRKEELFLGLPAAVFCSGVAAASAISLATNEANPPRSLILYNGRLELVKHDLPWLPSPTLILVSESDEILVEANEMAAARITKGPRSLCVLPKNGEGIDLAIRETVKWLNEHMPPGPKK